MKSFVKSLIPPILLTFVRQMREKVKSSNKKPDYSPEVVFNYDEFNNDYENPWDSPNWIKHEKGKLANQLSSTNIHQKSVITSTRILNKFSGHNAVHIIDFGGGAGTLIRHLIKSFSEDDVELSLSIIDSVNLINCGRNTFSSLKNVKFFEQDTVDIKSIARNFKKQKNAIVLNLSSVIQYIPNYQNFLKKLIDESQPDLVNITRFPRCENAINDAFAIQNISTKLGFCGSSIVNLFAKDTLVLTMKSLGYNLLFEDFNDLNDMQYFQKCNDERYRNITLVAYTFVRNENVTKITY